MGVSRGREERDAKGEHVGCMALYGLVGVLEKGQGRWADTVLTMHFPDSLDTYIVSVSACPYRYQSVHACTMHTMVLIQGVSTSVLVVT